MLAACKFSKRFTFIIARRRELPASRVSAQACSLKVSMSLMAGITYCWCRDFTPVPGNMRYHLQEYSRHLRTNLYTYDVRHSSSAIGRSQSRGAGACLRQPSRCNLHPHSTPELHRILASRIDSLAMLSCRANVVF